MDKETKQAPVGVSASGIMALVAVVTGALLYGSIPLKSTRPDVAESPSQRPLYWQNVDARLWQDPLGVITRALHDSGRVASSGSATSGDRSPPSGKGSCGDGVPYTAAWMARQIHRQDSVASAARGGEDEGAKAGMQNAKAQKEHMTEVLAVMLPGGPYAENIETRRRFRYAVVAALNAGGLEPADSAHLGYFVPDVDSEPHLLPLPQVVPFEWFVSTTDRPRRDDRPDRRTLLLWLDAGAFASSPIRQMLRLVGQLSCEPAAIRWRVLGPASSDEMRAMVEEASLTTPLGREGDLARLRYYSALATASDEALLRDVAIPGRSTDLAGFFKKKDIQLVRTVADDEAMANALVSELKLRGLKAMSIASKAGDRPGDARRLACVHDNAEPGTTPSHIAIVAEWDTLFGRSMRRNYRADDERVGFCVERFSYLRGLDGLVPQRGKRTSESQDSTSFKSDAGNAAQRERGGQMERAEGQGQFDYLRRLAAQMRLRDNELRARGSPGIRAIGVLGSDVHDKLLVLKALQPEFPNALFFTTEMDQRLLHPREMAATHNLIVASSFGLSLSRGLQAGVPPFRDSSQTALFLATRVAPDDGRRALLAKVGAASATLSTESTAEPLSQNNIDSWLVRPRVFELGRTRAFDFSKANFPSELHKEKIDRCHGTSWTSCRDVHPDGTPMAPTRSVPSMAVIFSVIVLGLWLPAVLIRRRSRRYALSKSEKSSETSAAGSAPSTEEPPQPTDVPQSESNPGSQAQHAPPCRACVVGAWVAALVMLQVALPVWLAFQWNDFALWLTRDGKPLVAFEGISLWPTEGIRLFTTVLCIYLIWEAWSALDHNLDEIGHELKLETSRRQFLEAQRKSDLEVRWTTKLRRIFSWEMFKSFPRSQTTLDRAMSADAIDFWHQYLIQNRHVARMTRTASLVALAWAVGALLTVPLNEVLVLPHRGELSLWVHRALSVSVHLAVSVLVFFVIDATALCVMFVRGLRTHTANWPDTVLEEFEERMAFPRGKHLDNWIDLRFVALRTKMVGRLIYYPFIVLSLLLLSRSTMFDDWDMPMGSAFVAVSCVGAAIGCAVALRIMAERSRRHAMAGLRDDLIRLHGATSDGTRGRTEAPSDAVALKDPTARQVELLLSRIENLREGAFAPFSQQPLLKALLLPFAAFGGTTLLDALALANL